MTRSRGAWLGAWLVMVGCSAGGDAPPSVKDEPLLVAPPPSQVLVRQEEAGREACAHGGSRVRSGLDANGDGQLEDSEVQHSQLVCYPAPVPAEGRRVLVRLEPVPAGPVCAEGGSAVLSGLDGDQDGTLADAEVQHREVICRERLLTRLSPAAGACPGQGVAIGFGRDLDGDGVLSEAEVVTTQVQCGNALSGELLIRSARELEALASIRFIVGSIRFTDLGVETLSLPGLETVTGSLIVERQSKLKSLSLPGLESVGQDLELNVNLLLERVDFARLRSVKGMLGLGGLPRLTTLAGWPVLESVGRVSLANNDGLVDLRGLAALRVVSDTFWMYGNDALVDVSLNLPQVGEVVVQNQGSLRTLSVRSDSGASAVPIRAIRVEENPALTALTLGSYGTQLEHLLISDNPVLQQVTVASQSINGALVIEDNAALTRLVAPHLTWVFGGVLLRRSPLERIDCAAPFGVGGLEVIGTRLTALQASRHIHTVVGDTTLQDNPLLTTLELSSLGGTLNVVRNPVLSSLSITHTDTLEGGLFVVGNSRLTSLEDVHVREIRGELLLQGGPQMTRVGLAGLRSVAGPVSLWGSQLVDVGLEDLEFVGGFLRVESTAMTRWRGMGALRRVQGPVWVFEHPSLQDVNLPQLRAADTLLISGNKGLKRLDLPLFTSTTSAGVHDNKALPVCEVARFFSQLPPGVGSQSGNDASGTCP